MKKLAFIGLCCACVSSVYAATCGEEEIALKGAQRYNDNEFLYAGYWEWSSHHLGYECDNDSCNDGATVTLFPGHYWNGVEINETRTYRCKLSVLGDRWEVVSKDKVNGDIVGRRWCSINMSSDGLNPVTKRSNSTFSLVTPEDKHFKDLKAVFDGETKEQVKTIIAKCTTKGWGEPMVLSCEWPYAPCNNKCVHYTSVLDKAIKSGYETHEKLYKASGASEDDYNAFVKGTLKNKGVEESIRRKIGERVWYNSYCAEYLKKYEEDLYENQKRK